MSRAWSTLHQAMLDLIYPPRCVVEACGAPGHWLCPRCTGAIAALPHPRCAWCGAPRDAVDGCPDCGGEPPPFERATAAGVYAPPLRDAIRALKYRHVRPVAPVLGRLAAAAHRAAADAAAPRAVVVPIPSHPRRAAERAIDHTRLLADAVGTALALPVRTDLVVRTRHTRPQVGLTRSERRANVDGAFAVAGAQGPQSVILVDDVMTTGATARACAAALRGAGVAHVAVCTVARAVAPQEAAGPVSARPSHAAPPPGAHPDPGDQAPPPVTPAR